MIEQPTILYEDSDILVLDKPAGITVNTADTTKGEKTMQEWVENYLKAPQIQVSKGEEAHGTRDTLDTHDTFLERAGIVHRLDKETSGILIVAKTPESFENLQKQFKNRTVKKKYIALVHGIVEPPDGEIAAPVGRLPWNRKRFGVVAGGREAVTRYRVISNFQEEMSLVELYPETGRTHQIRVHLKHIGHPVFADPLYAGRKTARNDRAVLPRVFLHASFIRFSHPASGVTVTYESPLPTALRKILESMRENVDS